MARTRQSQTAAASPASNIAGLGGLLSAVLAQTSNIQASDNSIDSKAHNLMAAALVIVALLGTQIKTASGEWDVFTIISMGILIVATGLVVYLTRSQDYDGAVVNLNRHPEYFLKDDELLLAQLVRDAHKAKTIL